MSKRWLQAVQAGALLLVLASYQNCVPNKFESLKTASTQMESGNGGAYEGKITLFSLFDPNSRCSPGANGKPLPNEQVLVHSKGPAIARVQVTREACADLPMPRDLEPSSVTMDETAGTLSVIEGATTKMLGAYPVGEFDVVRASCPTGYDPIPNATRTNIGGMGQRMDWWFPYNVKVDIVGTMLGMPKNQIMRIDASAPWYRVQEGVRVEQGKLYAMSFLAEPGTVSKASFFWHEPDTDGDFGFETDLTAVSPAYNDLGGTASRVTEFKKVQMGNAMYVTMYFTSTATGDMVPGISASRLPVSQVGDSVFATAFQLEDVSTFCTKL